MEMMETRHSVCARSDGDEAVQVSVLWFVLFYVTFLFPEKVFTKLIIFLNNRCRIKVVRYFFSKRTEWLCFLL